MARTANGLVVLCDSRAALEVAYGDGLPRETPIRCSSPSMLLDPDLACEELDARLSGARLGAFIDQINAFTLALYRQAKDDPDLSRCAITIARTFNRYQKQLRKAACLGPEDFAEPRLALQVDCGNAFMNGLLNAPWDRLLASNAEAEIRAAAVSLPAFGQTVGGGQASLAARLRIVGLRRVLYPAVMRLWRLLPGRWSRGDVVVLKDNELVKETALAFAARGYRVSLAPLPTSFPPAELSAPLAARIEAMVVEDFKRSFADWIQPAALSVLASAIEKEAGVQVAEQLAARDHWARWFDRQPAKHRRAVLTNAPNGPAIAGLADVCVQHGVPLIAFQHGIRREIADTPIDLQINSENNVADLLIAYSERGAQVSDTNPYRRGGSAAVGLPGDYYRTSRSRGSGGQAPILYVSTTLYLGNVQLLTATASDAERARREVALIDQLFAAAPQRVAFKPYPALRYPDPDPIIVAARACPNVELYEREIDLRYMIGGHRLVMTSGATSTVGWCALSGLPLVMIDWPDVQPLDAEMRVRFAEAFFLFDGGAPDLMEKLAAFLARPLADIEREAAGKAAAREALLREVFGAWGPGAGRRAAKAITARFFQGESAAGAAGAAKRTARTAS